MTLKEWCERKYGSATNKEDVRAKAQELRNNYLSSRQIAAIVGRSYYWVLKNTKPVRFISPNTLTINRPPKEKTLLVYKGQPLGYFIPLEDTEDARDV